MRKILIALFLFLLTACTVIVLETEKEQTATIIIDQGTGSVEPVILKPHGVPWPAKK